MLSKWSQNVSKFRYPVIDKEEFRVHLTMTLVDIMSKHFNILLRCWVNKKMEGSFLRVRTVYRKKFDEQLNWTVIMFNKFSCLNFHKYFSSAWQNFNHFFVIFFQAFFTLETKLFASKGLTFRYENILIMSRLSLIIVVALALATDALGECFKLFY